jgi:hypothetical protein
LLSLVLVLVIVIVILIVGTSAILTARPRHGERAVLAALVFVDCQLGLEEGKMKRSTKPERMDEPFSFKLDDRSHQSCVLHELGGNARVMSKLLRSGLLKKCAQTNRTFTPLSLVLFSSAGCKSAEAITRLCAGARLTR